MRITRRTTRLTIAVVALALVASACTFGESSTTAPSGSGDDGAPVTLRVWTHQNKSFNQATKALAAEYTQQHPNVTFEFETFDYDTYVTTLQTALPAGTEADILQMFGTWTCSYKGNLATMPTDVASLEQAQEEFFAAPIGGYICDDQLYGFPQEFNIEYGATLVNTAMAGDAGVSTDGWASWDEFIADAKKMTVTQDGAVIRAGYNFTAADALSYSFYSLILQNDGQFLSEDGTSFTINTTEGKAALELLKRMVDEGIIDPTLFNDEANWVGDCFFEENCAMGLVGPWVIPEYSGDFPDVAANTTYVPLPTVDNASFVADSGWGLTVANSSPNATTAWDFISFVAQDPTNAAEWNAATGTLPALKANAEGAVKDQLVAEFPHFAPWFDILPNGQFVGQLPDRDLLWYDITYPTLLAALDGSMTVDEALIQLEQQANDTF